MQLMINTTAPHQLLKCGYRGYVIQCRIYRNYKGSGRTFYATSAGGDIWDKGWYWSRGIPSVIAQIDLKLNSGI
jgi:hypothetical protein